jgi:hypothetical protein
MPDQPSPTPKRLNADQKRRLRAAEVQLFAKQYSRPAQKGKEPNHRQYPRKTEKKVKQMRPTELDELLRGED